MTNQHDSDELIDVCARYAAIKIEDGEYVHPMDRVTYKLSETDETLVEDMTILLSRLIALAKASAEKDKRIAELEESVRILGSCLAAAEEELGSMPQYQKDALELLK